MANGHGGKRTGAGRKKGSVNKRTRDLTHAAIDRIEETDGSLPIEVMVDLMQHNYTKWVNSGRKNEKAANAAGGWADRCAPFFHAKLSSVTLDGDSEDGGVQVTINKPGEPTETPDSASE